MTGTRATDSSRRQFGAVAAAYANAPVHAAGPDLPAFVAAAALTGAEEVLDVGCGAGHSTLALAPGARQVTGLDVTPEMLAFAGNLALERGAANVSFRVGDALALPFGDASFEVVTSRFSAHHYPDPVPAVAEARRVLRHAGRFVLVDTVAPEDPALDTFCNAFELLRDASHVRNNRASEWLRMFESAGFAASVTFRLDLELDGQAWVERANTPPARVGALRELFVSAPAAARAAFTVRDQPWAFTIPVVLVLGLAR